MGLHVGAEPVTIIGAGGHGREILDIVEAVDASGARRYRFVGFVDDRLTDSTRVEARGARLLPGLDAPELAGAGYLVGIGEGAVRRAVVERAEAAGLTAVDAWHPSAAFGSLVTWGEGFVAFAHVSVTTNVAMGRHVHLNQNCTVAHDCSLADFVTVLPGATVSGDVTLEAEVTVGTGAAVIQGLTIGAGTLVGAGAVVTRDLPAGVVAAGVPARILRERA